MENDNLEDALLFLESALTSASITPGLRHDIEGAIREIKRAQERAMLAAAPSEPAREWDHRYRQLAEGEIILVGDEVLTDSKLGWRPAEHTIGQTAPCPYYTAHRIYRRLASEPAEERPVAWQYRMRAC